MFVLYNLKVSDAYAKEHDNAGGRTLALRTRLFTPIEPAYPCLAYAKEHDT